MPADTCDVSDTSGVDVGGSDNSPMRTESLDRHSSCIGSYTLATETAAPVSVVIPCYRCAGTIARAVDSVFTQSCRPAELFLVDDCSADGTLEALFRLRDSYPQAWITVISLPQNTGPASARNAGWEAATCPYIAFLDADDAWHRRKNELQLGWMLAHPEVALTGHACRVVEAGDEIGGCDAIGHAPIEFKTVKGLRLLLSNCFSTPCVMLKRDVPHRFASGKFCAEDYLLWCEICLSGLGCCWNSLPLAFLFKERYGSHGLSGKLWPMEKGELDCYARLHKSGYFGILALKLLQMISLLKFMKRVLMVRLTGR